MTKTMPSIESTALVWREQIASRTLQHRLLTRYPIHLYYGVDGVSQPVFFLVSEVQPHPPSITGLLTIEVRRREDEKWVAVLTLKDLDYVDAFMSMCLELARRTSAAESESAGVELFDVTLTHWQRLLGKLGLRTLSETEIRGLYAELYFGLRLASASSFEEMVHAWQGPLGASQDFRHPILGHFEVKAVGVDARSVQISSIAQLDPSPAAKVDLVVVRLEEDSLSASPSSRTLAAIIRAVRQALVADAAALEEFDDRIARLGVELEDPLYDTTPFSVVAVANYRTETAFPRLRAVETPAGVEKVRYEILMAALQPFAYPLELALSNEMEGSD